MTNADINKKAAFLLSLFARQSQHKNLSKKWLQINAAISDIYNEMAAKGDSTFSAFDLAAETLDKNNPGLDWERNWEQAL